MLSPVNPDLIEQLKNNRSSNQHLFFRSYGQKRKKKKRKRKAENVWLRLLALKPETPSISDARVLFITIRTFALLHEDSNNEPLL